MNMLKSKELVWGTQNYFGILNALQTGFSTQLSPGLHSYIILSLPIHSSELDPDLDAKTIFFDPGTVLKHQSLEKRTSRTSMRVHATLNLAWLAGREGLLKIL
jgi:hypothetical protein